MTSSDTEAAGQPANAAPLAAIPTDHELLARLRARLRAAGYSEWRLMRALGSPVRLSVVGLVEVLDRRLDPAAELSALFRVFWLGLPASRDAVADALAPLALEELAAAGVIALSAGEVRPLIAISPYRDLVVAHDHGRRVSDRQPAFVTSVNSSSSLMDWLTIRRPVSSALDLGSGCGVQALLAARHAETVTAVDVNPRAVEYTALNAALNGIRNVDALQGAWFEPVAGRRFDLVVANLPFVVSPDARYTYRDSGLDADGASRLVLARVADHLEEGGLAHVFCNWLVPAGGDWRRPLEETIAGTGCDALLLLHARRDPLTYAATWNHPLDEEDEPEFSRTVDRWLEHYRQTGIEEIADGMVILRRRSGRNFVRALEVPAAPTRPAGEHLLRLFEGYDTLSRLPEAEAILDLTFAFPDGATVDGRYFARGRSLQAAPVRIGLRDGAGFSALVEPAVATVLLRCNGRTPLRQLLERDATARPEDVAGAARRLLGLGLLVVAGARSP